MTATTAPVPVPERRVPPMGGFNSTLLRLELRRMLRNRRTVIFSVVLPVVFFLLFGTGKDYSLQSAGPHGNWAGAIMISMALYGAMLSTTAGGAMVSTERSQGWSRQLRLTPLTPTAYIAVKVLVAMLLGAISVVVVYAVGALSQARLDPHVWWETGVIVWLGSLVFAAFGVFMGYLLPSDNVMQILGPGLALLAFLGGLFTPLDQMGHTFQTIAKFTPMYGVSELGHAPLTGGGPGWAALVNVLVWLALFTGGAAWRFRRDTARV
jgi:ABC-2 type transport system permease protein